MPREIKFRAWNENTKGYCYDAQDAYDTLGWSKAQSKHGYPAQSFGHFFNDDFFVVEQYTGLTDKNGTEIYEGDVVKWYVNDKMVMAPVGFEHGAFWMLEAINKNYGNVYNDWGRGEYEVIGNVHEHSELLK